MPPQPVRTRQNAALVVTGTLVVVLGLMLLSNYRYPFELQGSANLWPMLLLLLGAARLADVGTDLQGRRRRRTGAWLVFVGLWGLVSEFRLFGVDDGTSWPLLMVAAGAVIVWRALDSSGYPAAEREGR